ncbi:MAG: triose-phosphate isomerase [Pseudomonadales bacterium]|nr:triose-phosphate isomerase [Pseudomonadales bacterium]MBO7006257.1 triose-phosphate isomerase [Pseudomonadales bacterium]
MSAKSRTPLVAGNWKMNGSKAFIRGLLDDVQSELQPLALERCSVLVFPSYAYLYAVADQLRGSSIGVGAQDVDERPEGAVTGGVSAGMVRDLGCGFAIVGHSERRTLFGESDSTVAEKYDRCCEQNLTTIVCVGETLEEREAGQTLEVVHRQLKAVTDRVGVDFAGSMVAYEPVWAIGTGRSATPDQAEEVQASLRACLAEVDAGLAEATSILYGGSVTAENAQSLFEMNNIDGALVGGASLKADNFAKICEVAERVKR